MKTCSGGSKGFPSASYDKQSACNAKDPGVIPGLGRYTGEGKDYPLQYSCLDNSMDRGAWWATAHGVTKSQTQLSELQQQQQLLWLYYITWQKRL